MSERPNPLTAAYSRGRDQQWMAQKRRSHRRWRRRALLIGSGLAAAAFVVAFIVYGYPRESGLTDALGLTCGEYVEVGDPAEVQQPFDDWAGHQQVLSNDDDVDDQQLLAAVELIAEEADAEPTLGQFGPGGLTEREHSVSAAGEHLLIGHHEEYWTSTDRVSVLDPETATTTWTAETTHPAPNHDLADEGRQRVLYGVGATDSRTVLQTPTYRGDTDLVIAEFDSGDSPLCLRLEGAADTQQILSEHEGEVTAWSQVVDLNTFRTGQHEFLIHHGLDGETSGHRLSAVDVVTETVESAEAPLEAQPDEDAMQIPAEAQQEFDDGFDSLQPVGEDHLLLTWELGAVILERR